MYKRLLVPTDGSELSLDAVRGAASFAEAMHSEVVLITVIEPYSYTSLSEYRPESIDDYDERVRTVAEERLAEARAILEEKSIKVQTLSVKFAGGSHYGRVFRKGLRLRVYGQPRPQGHCRSPSG